MTNILAILPSRNEQAPPHPKTLKLRLSASVRLPGPSRVPAAGSGASRSPGSSNLNRRSQSFNSIDKGKPLQYASGNDRGESREEHILGPHRRNEGCVRVMKISGQAAGLSPLPFSIPATWWHHGLRQGVWKDAPSAWVWLKVGVSVYLTRKVIVFYFLFFWLGVVWFLT